MKLATVEAFFSEVKGNPYRTGRGKATTSPAAISRAFKEVFKQLRGKRIHTLTATLTIIDVQPEAEGQL